MAETEATQEERCVVTIYFTDKETLRCVMSPAERERLTSEFLSHVNTGPLQSKRRGGVYDIQINDPITKLAINFDLVRYIA